MITRRQKRKGKDRRCKSCKQVLSIYNDDMLCGLCQVNPKDVDKALKDIKGRMNEKR
jgi:Zn finger protein HypA/HybF involved in hydrogenase expression